MTSPKLVLYLMCLFLGKIALTTNRKISSSVQQEKRFISANAGGNVTLPCYIEDDDTNWLYWFKLTLGQKPRIISNAYKYYAKPTFYHEFNKSRFTLAHGKKGITISVKGSGLNPPPSGASEIIQSGDSVTLNCTVHTGSCDGEHSVYWFKNSEDSPGLLYIRGGSQCERKPNTHTHTCEYNLPMESLNPSHAGTYYCAVASCGHILFGNGTKLDFEDEVDSLVYFLSGALAFNSILVVLLAFLVHKMKKRNNCQSTVSEVRLSTPSTANAEGYRDANCLHYAALSVNVPSRSRRQRNINNNECVYSGVQL
ncbi:uncharacterized protein [Pseudochaenichthys georgianus]|uniref:uncharacterized protein isoform X2 n=1 Tax=Pseudochaenichthys georgianus TaxID=52239 RepID=UPI00146B79A1|nr:uncharacterized protein LOC117463962 isoform X2 [Pseudochaenichthys georgianus]